MKSTTCVVTIGSRGRTRDMATGEADTYTLVYPGGASFEEGKRSVLVPLESAIRGERVGDVVRVRAPAGMRRVKIARILSRPATRRRRVPEPVHH